MREIVDHYFPPVGTLIKEGGEEYTDFNYWRERPLEVDDFSASESEDSDEEYDLRGRPSVDESIRSEDDAGEEEDGDLPADMEDSFYSRGSMDSAADAERGLEDSIMEGDEVEPGELDRMLLDGATPVAEPDEVEGDLSEKMNGLRVVSAADKTPVARPRDLHDGFEGEVLRPLTTTSPRSD
jgi:phosphatidate phosphatase LPIN